MFYKRFPDTESSYQYLAAIKWEEGYICKKCNHITFVRQESLIRTAIDVVSRTKVQRRAQYCLISVRSKQRADKNVICGAFSRVWSATNNLLGL